MGVCASCAKSAHAVRGGRGVWQVVGPPGGLAGRRGGCVFGSVAHRRTVRGFVALPALDARNDEVAEQPRVGPVGVAALAVHVAPVWSGLLEPAVCVRRHAFEGGKRGG